MQDVNEAGDKPPEAVCTAAAASEEDGGDIRPVPATTPKVLFLIVFENLHKSLGRLTLYTFKNMIYFSWRVGLERS
jgi:hypothetical protein